MNVKELTLEMAVKVIAEYPEVDMFIDGYFERRVTARDYSDNSMELHSYWQKCKRLVESEGVIPEFVTEDTGKCMYWVLAVCVSPESLLGWIIFAGIVGAALASPIAYWYGCTKENRDKIKEWKTRRYPSAGTSKRN